MYTTRGCTLAEDLGFKGEHEGKTMLLPGVSTLRKNADGSIERIGVSMFGPGDNFCSVWHFFGLLEEKEAAGG
jgi:hypothetical protein